MEPFEIVVFVEKKHEGRKYADVKNAWSNALSTYELTKCGCGDLTAGKPPLPEKFNGLAKERFPHTLLRQISNIGKAIILSLLLSDGCELAKTMKLKNTRKFLLSDKM